MRYLSRHPERVDRRALITPGVRAVGLTITDRLRRETVLPRRDEPWFPAAFAALEAIGAGAATIEKFRAIAPFFYSRWDEVAQAHKAAEGEQVNRDVVAAFGADGAFGPEADRTALARFAAPVLLLAGEVDVGAPAPTTAEFTAFFPGAHLVVQPEAGHCPWLDDADRFMATTVEFLHGAATHVP
nr:alpha/beta hydrolase [Streptomyces sp. IMTB 2501]